MTKFGPHGYRHGIRWDEFFAIPANRERPAPEIARSLGVAPRRVLEASYRHKVKLPDGRAFNPARDMAGPRAALAKRVREEEQARKARQAEKLARFKADAEKWAAQMGVQL